MMGHEMPGFGREAAVLQCVAERLRERAGLMEVDIGKIASALDAAASSLLVARPHTGTPCLPGDRYDIAFDRIPS